MQVIHKPYAGNSTVCEKYKTEYAESTKTARATKASTFEGQWKLIAHLKAPSPLNPPNAIKEMEIYKKYKTKNMQKVQNRVCKKSKDYTEQSAGRAGPD